MNQNGQEFEGYRLLIAIIMAALILIIIISSIEYFEDLRLRVSEDKMKRGFATATKYFSQDSSISDDKLIAAEDVYLSKMVYRTVFFTDRTSVDADCVIFESSNSNSIELLDSSRIEIKSEIKTDVYFFCYRSSRDSCPIECKIFFGYKP